MIFVPKPIISAQQLEELSQLNNVMDRYIERRKFIEESNHIEGIDRAPTPEEEQELGRFLSLKELTTAHLKKFVSIYQPNAVLRDKPGLNVCVMKKGKVIFEAPPGGRGIKAELDTILSAANGTPEGESRQELAFHIHQKYEHLHPFTDGNGRSGRAIWLWMMGDAPLGFLHQFYYQALNNWRKA